MATQVGSVDPNNIQGPSGFSAQGFVQPELFSYAIEFENKPSATAPAQTVVVTQQLDSNLDWSTFQLGSFGFGDTVIDVPSGRTSFSTQVDAIAARGVYVDVTASFNPLTGLATWTFTSIDPTTLDVPADPLVGFLPPDSDLGAGQGFVNYSVRAKSALATGTKINAQASVVFDVNAPLATAPIVNTIDVGPPTSTVAALPATETNASFPVTWSGHDDQSGSGIAVYDIFVSDNGAAFTLWQSATTQLSAMYTSQSGHTYGFYSVATDNVGNREATPTMAEASTVVQTATQSSTMTTVSSDHNAGSVYGQNVTFTATVVAGSSGFGTPSGSVQFEIDGADVGSSVVLSGGMASYNTSSLIASGHVITGVYTSDNTSFSNSQGQFSQTVNPAPLSITADDNTKAYGAALPTLTIHYSTFVNGDTSASLTTLPTVVTTATAASHASDYSITVSGAVDPNYSISYISGTLHVTPVGLTITADNKTKAYGAGLPALTVSYSGFVNGDTSASLTTLPTVTTTATAASHVGGYAITASGAVDGDYTIGYAPGTLHVTPVGLTITADNKTKAYGAGLPALTVSYFGFVNGDTSASLTTLPTVTTTAITASHVGGYAITASGAVDGDYTISYAPGTLTVTAVGLMITADNKTKAYGAGLPALTVSYSGFVNGDTSASLTTLPTVTTTAIAASHVGGYAITASGAVDGDYTIGYAPGTLTVTPVGLTITADNKTKAYGAGLPALTVSYSGFVNGDTSASLTTLPTVTTTATAASHVGGYAITASGAVDGDYTLSYAPGTLTVSPVGLTITADNKSKVVGAVNPPLTFTAIGFVNGDTMTSLATSPTLSTPATTLSPLGNYPIYVSEAVDSDYAINYVNGTLTVYSNVNAGILLLDLSGNGALTDTGNGTIQVSNGNIIVDSNSSTAAIDSGNGHVSALEIDVTGAVKQSGKGRFIGTVKTGTSPLADPLVGFMAPTASGPRFTSANVSGKTPATLSPGVYVGGIHLSGNASATLLPGIYYLQGGGLNVSGNATLSGSGVMIYNAPQNSTDSIVVSGKANVTLTAPQTGDYRGIVLFQDRNSNVPINLSGGGSLSLTGTVYAAKALLSVTGNDSQSVLGTALAGASAALIVGDLTVSGNGQLSVTTFVQSATATAAARSASSSTSSSSLATAMAALPAASAKSAAASGTNLHATLDLLARDLANREQQWTTTIGSPNNSFVPNSKGSWSNPSQADKARDSLFDSFRISGGF